MSIFIIIISYFLWALGLTFMFFCFAYKIAENELDNDSIRMSKRLKLSLKIILFLGGPFTWFLIYCFYRLCNKKI